MCWGPREEGKSVVASRKDKMVSIAEEKKNNQTNNYSAHLSKLGKITNLREQSIITSHLQGPDVLFSPLKWISLEVKMKSERKTRSIWVNEGN